MSIVNAFIGRIILMSTDENDIVLETFVSIGTMVIDAKRLGKKFIIINIDKKYVNIAKQALKGNIKL